MKTRNPIWGTFSVLSLLAVLSVWSLNAAQYLTIAPLSSVVKVPVGQVKDTGVIQLPLITWGGDIATILANGGVVTTEKGSIFDQQGFKIKLVREDDFQKQLQSYIRGDSPYLRGTMGMVNQAAELLNKDPRLKPIVIYQMTWSAGGDVLVVKSNIKTGADLKGKTIAVQAYGPHVDYLTTALADFGIGIKDVNIKWVKDLTATSETPGEALKDPKVDAAFVISPDAATLTSNGAEGTGAEGSIKGARALLSTKSANRIIADVYVTSAAYFESHAAEVQKFVHALLLAQESLDQLFKNPGAHKAELDKLIAGAGSILLDNPKDVDGVKGLYGDCEFVGYQGNVKFFNDPNYPRRFSVLNNDIQKAFIGLGLLSGNAPLAEANLDFEALKKGLFNTAVAESPRFQADVVAQIINKRSEQGTLGQGEIFSFEINFEPNASVFSPTTYQKEFDRVVDLASTYSGAIVTVEGHADVMPFLIAKSKNDMVTANNQKQSAKNLSLKRAANVRDTIIEFAKNKHIIVDPTQFAVVGAGITTPKTGIDKRTHDPNPPANEEQWKSNMRVVFRLVGVDAEQNVFTPVGGAAK